MACDDPVPGVRGRLPDVPPFAKTVDIDGFAKSARRAC
jgi:hypothetical protein